MSSKMSSLSARLFQSIKQQFTNKTGPRMRFPGAWIAPGEIPLATFLADYRPSRNDTMHLSADNTNHRTPFYWVMSRPQGEESQANEEGFIQESAPIVERMLQDWKEASAESRSKLNDQFKQDIARIAKSSNITSGKWNFFAKSKEVDQIWSSLSNSLVTPGGALSTSSARTLKIPSVVGRADKYEISLICEDSFEQDKMRSIVKELLLMNVTPVNYRSDASILLGLDGTGPSDTLYTLSDFFSLEEAEMLLKSAKPVEEKSEI